MCIAKKDSRGILFQKEKVVFIVYVTRHILYIPYTLYRDMLYILYTFFCHNKFVKYKIFYQYLYNLESFSIIEFFAHLSTVAEKIIFKYGRGMSYFAVFHTKKYSLSNEIIYKQRLTLQDFFSISSTHCLVDFFCSPSNIFLDFVFLLQTYLNSPLYQSRFIFFALLCFVNSTVQRCFCFLALFFSQ